MLIGPKLYYGYYFWAAKRLCAGDDIGMPNKAPGLSCEDVRPTTRSFQGPEARRILDKEYRVVLGIM
jgi:hypothetical protein